MLKSITIKNFAIIESVDVEWTPGLNVLTGETGAGKSILFDALSIVLGAKAGPANIRAGAQNAAIEAFFIPGKEALDWLAKNELADGAEELVVTREISEKSSRSRINGVLVNSALLQELRGLLLTFHAQHEIRTLLTASSQLALLDSLGDRTHESLSNSYKSKFASYQALLKQASESLSDEERLKKLEFTRWEIQELEAAALGDPAEDEELKERRAILEGSAQLEANVMSAVRMLSGGDEHDSSVIDLLQRSLAELETASSTDSSLAATAELLSASLANAEEAASELRTYRDRIDSDPESLAIVEERQTLLASVKRKFGPTLKEAIDRLESLRLTIETLENADWQAEKLKGELLKLEGELTEQAEKLSASRQKLAESLSRSIMAELKQLGMERARFDIEFTRSGELSGTGLDRLEFLISPNPGQPLLPLSRIASGGELSRVMLALKTIFASADRVSTVVFDEIDTGMSGKTLTAIRDRLAKLARSHQILCITHNPIVASVADNYLDVCKEQSNDKTIISVRHLDGEERLSSLAAMASGSQNEEVSLTFARSLVDQASSIKAKLLQIS
ncbi:MAG: DNA repair protein RecN [Candidatus Melainabacteria bacterium]|nr:DNA repair protein RecN [Candidatus Melainabacteria bacterium]